MSRAEFAKAMTQLGYEGSAEDVGLVFDSMDPDGSGSLVYEELQVVQCTVVARIRTKKR